MCSRKNLGAASISCRVQHNKDGTTHYARGNLPFLPIYQPKELVKECIWVHSRINEPIRRHDRASLHEQH